MLMSNPIAVLISDIHFQVNTLELASLSLLRAQYKAFTLKVPLVICGDTLDSKAIMRAECVNRLISILNKDDAPETYILVGNHDMINEKGDDHSLVFLAPLATIVKCPLTRRFGSRIVLLNPYETSQEAFKSIIQDEDCPDTIICHQGLQGANMGHYMQDKTSLPPALLEGKRILSGHYHQAQDIKCGETGLWSYIGNPFTLTFGEANDPPKGYAILMDDGSLERVPLSLRKHVIIEEHIETVNSLLRAGCKVQPGDLLWLKIHGPASELAKVNKADLAKKLGISDFKLDKIPTSDMLEVIDKKQYTDSELFDRLIDATSEPTTEKQYLKQLWREICDSENA